MSELTLTERCNQLFREGYSDTEISRMVNISRQAVNKRRASYNKEHNVSSLIKTQLKAKIESETKKVIESQDAKGEAIKELMTTIAINDLELSKYNIEIQTERNSLCKRLCILVNEMLDSYEVTQAIDLKPYEARVESINQLIQDNQENSNLDTLKKEHEVALNELHARKQDNHIKFLDRVTKPLTIIARTMQST